MEKSIKKQLVAALQSSVFAQTNSADWNKPAQKVKSALILQQTAKGIAKKKIQIQNFLQQKQILHSHKLSYSLQKLQSTYINKAQKKQKLIRRKQDLQNQFQQLSDEQTLQLQKQIHQLGRINQENESMQEKIKQIQTTGEQELKKAQNRIMSLIKISDQALHQTHLQEDRLLQVQRSVKFIQVSCLSFLQADLQHLKQKSANYQRKLQILISLIQASKQHLSFIIGQKEVLLNQTKEAAHRIYSICEQTLLEEEEFYKQTDFDKMHTPPYIVVKRKERKQLMIIG